MIVLLNPRAGAGTALAKWRKAEPTVQRLVGPFETIVADSPQAAAQIVRSRLDEGELHLIAAGGDGTVNMVVSTIMRHGARESVKLGAIGLGSSNDFHKPANGRRRIAGAPHKLSFDAVVRHDVCLLMYEDESGITRFHHFLLNASIGTTAEANWLFNNPDRVLRLLKRVSADTGIGYAAIKTILRYQPQHFTLTVDEGPATELLAKNVGIVKNPNFTGSLRYDSPYEPGSGELYVHLLRKTSAARLAIILLGLLRGRFTGQPGTRSWSARRLTVSADTPFAVECDGEVTTTSRATFSVIPRLLQVCRQ
jgi:diacylglycerol kinase family enzyme